MNSVATRPYEAEAGTPAGAAERTPSDWWTLAALSLAMLLSSLGTSIANVALPTLARAFDAPFQSVQWIVLAYLLAVTTLIVGVGRLGDLAGRRRLLVAGIALFTGASILCGFAPALWVLVAARAAQGLGAAVMMALAMAFVADTVPRERLGSAMGLLGTTSAIGTALGPSLGGALIAGLGWRAIFLINVPLGALALLLAHRRLPRDSRRRGVGPEGVDVTGTVLLALTLGGYALAMTIGRGRFGVLNLALLLSAMIGVGAFLRVEARAASPLVRPATLRDRTLAASLGANALVSTVMMATLVVGPFYLTRALGLAPALVGFVLSVGPLVTALTGVPAGRLADRVGTRPSTLVGLAAMAAGSTLLSALPATFGIPGYVAPIVIVTVGYALFQTANNATVMSDVSADQRGVTSGLLSLSRNLGLVTGASVMGAVFALASGAADVATAPPVAVATGMRITFAVAAALIAVALAVVLGGRARQTNAAVLVALLAWITPARGQSSTPPASGREAPLPADPYPLRAAGWGPPAGYGLFVSRWAEDWTTVRATGAAPPLKAVPLGGSVVLTVSAEARVRLDSYDDALSARGNDYQQGLLRGTLGAELRLDRHLRLYGELGTGQVEGRRDVATPNFQNDASLQQLFVDARTHVRATLLGAMVGRQEFADGPRQLVSLSDGPNVHRTWNGVRLYAHGRRARLGAFDLRVTRPARGAFDETIDHAERLRGINASVIVSRGRAGADVYLDPFWIHSENPGFRSGGHVGHDERDTFGARLWGRRGALVLDWTLVRQTGRYERRDVDAWGLFAVQSLVLSDAGWKPRLDLRVDFASGGGARGTGTLREFNPLYASSGYLCEGQFLALANLAMLTPGVTVMPTSRMNLSLEYGFARRLDEGDAARAGATRIYPGTQDVLGREIGGLLRVAAAQSIGSYLTLFFTSEHLSAGDVLQRAGLPSGSYTQAGVTFRY